MSVSIDKTSTLRANMKHHEPIILENHPADSRVKICEDGIVQTLSSRMGTGGEHASRDYLRWNGTGNGNSGNGVAFAIVGDHEDRPTDFTNLVVYGRDDLHS